VKKHTCVVALVLALLISTFMGVLLDLTKANPAGMSIPELPPPIYIRENGTIEGAEGAIQKTGNTYTFVRDISKTIEIQRDNIILEGNSFTLTKPPEVNTEGLMTPIGWFPSIQISNRDNIIIRNIKFDKCHTSISVVKSSNVVIIQNNMTNGNLGVYMISSTNCNISGNEIIENAFTALYVQGSSFLNIAYNTISRNHFHGGWIAISYSNILRNNINNHVGDNVGIGLYLYGSNSHNYIFE